MILLHIRFYYFNGKQLLQKKLRDFANFWQNRESLFPRKRIHFLPSWYFVFKSKLFGECGKPNVIFYLKWHRNVSFYRVFRHFLQKTSTFTANRESLFSRKISKRVIRESLFPKCFRLLKVSSFKVEKTVLLVYAMLPNENKAAERCEPQRRVTFV